VVARQPHEGLLDAGVLGAVPFPEVCRQGDRFAEERVRVVAALGEHLVHTHGGRLTCLPALQVLHRRGGPPPPPRGYVRRLVLQAGEVLGPWGGRQPVEALETLAEVGEGPHGAPPTSRRRLGVRSAVIEGHFVQQRYAHGDGEVPETRSQVHDIVSFRIARL